MALRALFLFVDTDGLIRELSLSRDHDKWILGSTTEIIKVAGVTEKYSHTMEILWPHLVEADLKRHQLIEPIAIQDAYPSHAPSSRLTHGAIRATVT